MDERCNRALAVAAVVVVAACAGDDEAGGLARSDGGLPDSAGGTAASGGMASGATGGAAATAGSSGSSGDAGTGAAGSAGALSCADAGAIGVQGRTLTTGGEQLFVAGARVTLVGVSSFFETRSDAAGRFAFVGMPAGTYSLGASKRDLAYVELSVTLDTSCLTQDLALGPETHPGLWQTLGDPGETFGGTNSGVLLPDGRLMFCHDTLDPVIFDPTTGQKTMVPASPRRQGCHAVTLLSNGLLAYIGGTDQAVYGPGTRQVKTFNPATMTWQVRAEMNDYRWYPTLIPLPNGELLAVGGGGLDNPTRVSTSEIMNPATMTWTPVGNISIGNEVSPVVLLHTGEVLMTHRPPQLFNPSTGQWRAAGDFVQSPRMPNGDHADHELALLSDGRVVAIGYKTFTSGAWGSFVEIYDPVSNTWRLGANFAPVRSRASILVLPDERILVLGGHKEQTTDPTPVNAWDYMALTDLYDPERDAWRRLTPLSIAREYHATPILVPDGRVFVAGGEGEPGNEPPASTVEAFSPPYLFRGPRPEIMDLQQTALRRGESFSFRVAKTNAPTSVLLIGTIASTHFMDSGNGRFLELGFTQDGDRITASLPSEAARAVYGYYMLFVMVDDIPSVGRMVRVAP